MKQQRCPSCSKMMELIKTARGQVYSCSCGKTLPYRKKDDIAVAEIDTRDPALDTEEAKEHRRQLRRARAEYRRRNRGFWEKVDDFILFILLGTLFSWAVSTVCLVWLWPVAIVQVILGFVTMFIAERSAPAEETLIEMQTNRGMMFGGGLVGGLAAGLAGQGESTTSSTKLFGMMRDPIGCWREILLLLSGGGMVFTGVVGGVIWIVVSSAGGPQASKGLELQDEDYATARAGFHTNLLRKGPAPQDASPVQPPAGVDEVVYDSGTLHLKAWINAPKGNTERKPVVLYLHGGFAFGEDDWQQAKPFRDAGFLVMTPMLRGENGQSGNFSMFYDEVDDVLAAADYLAKQSYVDPKRIYVAGHSAGGTLTMLSAMASNKFRAAASLSGSPDRITFVNGGWKDKTPFDQSDIREFQLRSPIAYATSFKCPTRLYVGSKEGGYLGEMRRTATLAKQKGLDVEMVELSGDHFSYVPTGLQQAAEFFRGK